jgi:transcriptional regulator with PAS, ATPase and Fis domain
MRLLRVLQESEFERVGDSTPIKVDVRIIAATNQNLADKVGQGVFRQDLYYRLNVVHLLLPSLRERMDDLDLLITHFITKFNIKLNRSVQGVSDDVLGIFRSHVWPGNVRELEHAIEHACILSKSSIISVNDLPQDLLDAVCCVAESLPVESDFQQPLTGVLSLEEALARSNGNKSHAARLLGISRRTVYRHLENI